VARRPTIERSRKKGQRKKSGLCPSGEATASRNEELKKQPVRARILRSRPSADKRGKERKAQKSRNVRISSTREKGIEKKPLSNYDLEVGQID